MADNIQEMYDRARKAFEIVEFWPQEKVDEMCQAAAWEWQKEENRKLLARLSVDESGIGRYEDKVNKIKDKCLGTLWDQRDAKTCGVIEDIPEKNLKILAKPIGVIANVVPCTNPESTICALGLSMLKTRNAMIVSPHPRTPKSSYKTVELGRKALRKIGAPEDLMQCIEHPTNEKTQQLMAKCDYAVATEVRRWSRSSMRRVNRPRPSAPVTSFRSLMPRLISRPPPTRSCHRNVPTTRHPVPLRTPSPSKRVSSMR
ncbi:MAG TPA: aldehyde dehydrogenase family protein [Syntrophales bacterium]|nr:aldehyde dehydrogenase family protein [Syntrophales bacterium]